MVRQVQIRLAGTGFFLFQDRGGFSGVCTTSLSRTTRKRPRESNTGEMNGCFVNSYIQIAEGVKKKNYAEEAVWIPPNKPRPHQKKTTRPSGPRGPSVR